MTAPVDIAIHVPGEIVPWARAGGRGHIRFTPPKQRSYMGVLRQLGADAMRGRALMDGPLELVIVATWLRPKSHPKRKLTMPGACFKTSKPDLTNVVKIVEDALNLVVFADDAQVSRLVTEKRWGDRPGLTISVRSLATVAEMREAA